MTLTTDRLIQGDRLIRCRIIQVWLYLIIEFSSIFSSCLWKHNRQILSCSVFKQVLESGQWLHANQWNHKVSVLNISWKVCEFKHVVTISRQSYRMEQFRLSVQRNLGLLCLCFTLLYDWSRKLASLSQPIRCRTITNNCLVVRVFPRFRQFDYFYCAFSLAFWVFSFFFPHVSRAQRLAPARTRTRVVRLGAQCTDHWTTGLLDKAVALAYPRYSWPSMLKVAPCTVVHPNFFGLMGCYYFV